MCFVCGDFNIDLLNPLNQNTITEFINAMYSMSLYPSIIRPIRITTHSATLIDNIFTNVIDKKITSGLLINDLSDHLPVFATISCCKGTNKDIQVQLIRHKTKGTINYFKEDLIKQDWKEVYVEGVEMKPMINLYLYLQLFMTKTVL